MDEPNLLSQVQAMVAHIYGRCTGLKLQQAPLIVID